MHKSKTHPDTSGNEPLISANFITEIIDNDVQQGKYRSIVTRFPPEPNGYAHIGHAFASYIDFGIAQDYGGRCHLRMDDTNPEKESMEYAESLMEDMRWLGWNWQGHLYFASDYYEQLYQFAVRLIQEGKAYVDSLSEDDIQLYRGTVTQAGRASPYRERSVQENLELFTRMRAGDFANGAHVLRAKIDMASPNMKLRDPILYRILHTSHYRTGDTWCIYPMYDFAHPLSDAIEGISHSLCSLEFVENRAIYDWLVENLFEEPRPRQYEFGRRSLEYTVVSKRKLVQLVENGFVSGWDDPRMPTIAGLRRRGVTPEAVRDFVSRIGVSRTNRTVDIALFEHCIRNNLNTRSPRVMAILEPLKVILSNYPEGQTESLDAPYWPPDVPNEGSRKVSFSRELYIEQEDFSETPPKGFKRLSPGEYVRLRYAYVIRCDAVIRDASGRISELHCSYVPDSLGSNPKGIKIKGAIHWLSAETALPAEFRLYDRLFSVPHPDEDDGHFLQYLNKASLTSRQGFVEVSIEAWPSATRYQFERQGYFWQDPHDSRPDKPVYNRIISLKDSWQKPEVNKAKSTRAASTKIASEPGEARDLSLAFDEDQKLQLTRFLNLGVQQDDALLLAENPRLSRYFDEAHSVHANPQVLASWINNDIRRDMPADDPYALAIQPAQLANLIKEMDSQTISTRLAKDIYQLMLKSGQSPDAIIREHKLEQITDTSELEPVISQVLNDNPDKVSAYKDGKTGLIGFFVGQVMRATGGKANPQLLQALLRQRLDG